MDKQESGVNYILASSIENKDNELTLKNEVPKSEYIMKSNDMREGTLRNEPPLSEKSLKKHTSFPINEEPPYTRTQKEIPQREPFRDEKPVESKIEPEEEENPEEEKNPEGEEYSKQHKKVNEEGKIIWDTTHFVLAVEAGSNLILSY